MDDAIDDTIQDRRVDEIDDDSQDDVAGISDSTVLADPPVEPGEAVAETIAGHELDPADVEGGDEEIAEHVADGEDEPI